MLSDLVLRFTPSRIAPVAYERIFRTRSNRHTDFGRINTPRWAADNAAFGMYRAFDTITGVTHIRIEKEDSDGSTPAGTATYRLVETATASLRDTIQNSCGQYRGHNVWSQLNRNPDVDRWTNAWSGRKISGDLRMRHRNGGLSDLPYFYLCGINTRSDWDWGTVAFTRLVGPRSCALPLPPCKQKQTDAPDPLLSLASASSPSDLRPHVQTLRLGLCPLCSKPGLATWATTGATKAWSERSGRRGTETTTPIGIGTRPTDTLDSKATTRASTPSRSAWEAMRPANRSNDASHAIATRRQFRMLAGVPFARRVVSNGSIHGSEHKTWRAFRREPICFQAILPSTAPPNLTVTPSAVGPPFPSPLPPGLLASTPLDKF